MGAGKEDLMRQAPIETVVREGEPHGRGKITTRLFHLKNDESRQPDILGG
jgi:hypothetical protein